ncbi:MAG TPA: hypothetical protein VF717_09485 [Pyrinomonadaceae bacterium]|jgi:hypothetical protein
MIIIRKKVVEKRNDGSPYRVSRATIEVTGYSDEILLAAITEVLERLTEYHVKPNTVRIKGAPKKRIRNR